MPTSEVRLQRVDSIPLAVVRRRASAADLSTLVPECCGRVWSVVREQKVLAGRHVALYWDSSIRLEVGVELAGALTETEEVVRSATPSGMAAFVTHYGPYGELGAAHDAIHRWCEARGYRFVGPSWEIYGHWQSVWDADPSGIRTDVFYQIDP